MRGLDRSTVYGYQAKTDPAPPCPRCALERIIRRSAKVPIPAETLPRVAKDILLVRDALKHGGHAGIVP